MSETPDISKLTRANENPWYLMMTLYGEHEGEWVDDDLAEKNRRLWNAWICQGIPVEAHAGIAEKIRIDVEEMTWTDAKADEVTALFATRAKDSKTSLKMPDPNLTVDLSYTVFFNAVALERTIFKSTSFTGAHFGKMTDFGSAHFSETTYFRDAHFGEKTYFIGAHFDGMTDFIGAQFGETTIFRGAHFGETTYFISARFNGFSYFNDAKFGDGTRDCRLDLTNAVFEGPTFFEGAKFASHLPVLTGATLHEVTTLTVKGSHWPSRAKTGRGRQRPAQAKASAAKLRHVMAKQALPEEEHFFFRREMHHAARSEPFWQTAHIYLFEFVSDFGYSIARPANLLLVVWLLGAFFIYEGTAFGGGEALAYSFANMFKFFGLHRTYFEFETIRDWPAWVQWASGTQTVLAFILLFFLGLGLRTRFRLR